MNKFGSYYKDTRIDKGLTLRKFCIKNELDVGNHSKLERGLLPPPKSSNGIGMYLRFLGIEQNSTEWNIHFGMLRVYCLEYYTAKLIERFM
jgi:hypothetical protein